MESKFVSGKIRVSLAADAVVLQILGIGDQGVGGILISVAKLVLYTLCAGIHPSRVIPVVLDCGTNVRIAVSYEDRADAVQNKELLDDDLYLGLRQERVRGQRYDDFVEAFVTSAKKHYPKAYIHFVGPLIAKLGCAYIF